jgi:hypothetical protein
MANLDAIYEFANDSHDTQSVLDHLRTELGVEWPATEVDHVNGRLIAPDTSSLSGRSDLKVRARAGACHTTFDRDVSSLREEKAILDE